MFGLRQFLDIGSGLPAAPNTHEVAQSIALAILEYIPDLDEARRILAGLRAAIPPRSFLVISHTASDIHPRKMAEMIKRMNSHLAQGNLVGRPATRSHCFDGLDLMEPGVVKVNQWHLRSETECVGTRADTGGPAAGPRLEQRLHLAERARRPAWKGSRN